jgi:hypothetical protein
MVQAFGTAFSLSDHREHSGEVALDARPSQRVLFSGLLFERCTVGRDGFV